MLTRHDDYSFPQWELITRGMHDANSQPKSNDFQDVYNADHLVVWGYNLSEMLNQQQINFTLTQIKEIFAKNNKKITVIDPKYTNTAILAEADYVPVVQGTDPALIFGMLHYILNDKIEDLAKMYNRVLSLGIPEAATDPDFHAKLRQAVGKYVYGFFDTNSADDSAGTNNSYMLDDQTTFNSKAAVSAGSSLSAYIFGSSNTLVTNGLNQATSIYPEKIGYNVRSYQLDGEYDVLYDSTTGQSKQIDIYGQVEKTPAWAAAITGVPETQIKALADTFLTENVHCWMMGGLQRNSEGDQACWAWTILMNVLICFGKEGRSHGRADGRGNDLRKSVTMAWTSGIDTTSKIAAIDDKFKSYLNDTKTAWSEPLGETSLLTFPDNYNSNHSSTSISVFQWLDACDATNRDKIKETVWTCDDTGAAVSTEKDFYPARWNDGQVKRVPVPTKFIFLTGGNTGVNQNGDCHQAVQVWTAKDPSLVDTSEVPNCPGVQMNPYGYKVEFSGLVEVVMTSSCRWADLILPGSISFERYQTQSSGRSPLTSVTTKTVNPPGDAKVEIEIGAELAKAFGDESAYYNGMTPADGESFEEKVWLATLNSDTNIATFGMNADDWKNKGFHKPTDDLSKLDNYIAYKAFLENPGSDNRPTSSPGKTVNDVKTCFYTLSGRVEAYSLALMENYEMRMGNNIDENIDLVNSGTIYSKIAEARTLTGKGRFAYPIPMYIPLVEGIHADTSHPDPLGLDAQGYDCNLLTWHTIYRSHSTFNSSPLLNEVKYYKRNSKGEQAHINRNKTNVNAGLDNNNLLDSDQNAPLVWTDDVYETIWLNPATATANGIAENDLMVVESLRGKLVGSAHLSNRVREKTISMTQGSWFEPVDNWTGPSGTNHGTVDVGGNVNTLFSLRPCRIAGGMTLASECRVKIYKA